MGYVQRSVIVNAPAEEVFDLMIDTGRYGEWVFGFAGLDDVPAVLRQGDTFRWQMKGHGLTLRPRNKVTALEAPYRFEEEIRVPGLVRATLSKTVTRQKRRTQLSWTLSYQVTGGPLGVVADWLMAHRVARRAMEHSLNGAKRVLEAPARTAATRQRGQRRQAAAR